MKKKRETKEILVGLLVELEEMATKEAIKCKKKNRYELGYFTGCILAYNKILNLIEEAL